MGKLVAFTQTTLGYRLLLAVLWLACAASCVCVALFPSYRDFMYGYMWPFGVVTGWLGHAAWVRSRVRRASHGSLR